ncbi:MAG: hypothetical protein MJ227_02420 [Bacilli bacterium]|nr:hypothetical protein [Bacilli bacterium]
MEVSDEQILSLFSEFFEKKDKIGDELFNKVSDLSFPHINRRVKFESKYFIKSNKSIFSKINRRLIGSNEQECFIEGENLKQYCQCILDDITDYFRMNFEIDNDSFEKCAGLTLKTLLSLKGVLLNDKNPYSDDFNNPDSICKYFKVNLIYKGFPFEVQFHNKSSEYVNTITHEVYEVFRECRDNKTKEKLQIARENFYKDVIIPKYSADNIIKEAKSHGI